MGLQVRVRHALGERLMDLADRPPEHPLIIGRSREADVKIPSVTVANEHCVLFLHEQQWVLQDTSGGATYVNGHQVVAATPLCVGDVLVLGNDATPASIEIDPAGVAQGRSGHPAESHEPAPVAQAPTPRVATAYAATPAASVQPRAYSAQPVRQRYAVQPAPQQYSAPPQPQASYAAPQAQQDDPFAGWGPPAASDPSAPAAPRRKPVKKGNDSALIVGIAVCVLIVGGTAWLLYNRAHQPEVIVIKEQGSGSRSAAPKETNIFDFGRGSPAAPGTPTRDRNAINPEADIQLPGPKSPIAAPKAPTPSVPAPAPEPAPAPAPKADTDGAPPPPPAAAQTGHKDEAAWGDVVAAFNAEAGQAILKADDYRRNHPSEQFKDLDGMIDDAMDRLWWTRVKQLCDQQTSINEDLKKKDKEIKEETSPAFKKTLEAEKKPLLDKLSEVQQHLNGEMSYMGSDPPALDDKAMMQKLSDERDKDKFASWKVSTLKYIRKNHGAMPWNG